jgi:hypothetical protein
MDPSRIGDHPVPKAWVRDPIHAAEEDIRSYLFEHGILRLPKNRQVNSYPSLCLLGIYAAIALIILLGSLWLTRMECDPVFMDRGLTAACRNRASEVEKIVGSTGSISTNLAPLSISQ